MSTLRVTVDRENVNDEFVIVRKLHKHDGDPVLAEELVLEIESSKTISEVNAPGSGSLRIHPHEGDEIAIGGLLFEIVADAAGRGGTVDGAGTADRDGMVNRGNMAQPAAPDPGDTTERGTIERGGTSNGQVLHPLEAASAAAATEAKASRSATLLAQRLGVALRDIPSRGWITSADVLAATTPVAGTEVGAATLSNANGVAAPAAPNATAVVTATAPSAASTPTTAPAYRTAPKVPFRPEPTSLSKRKEARILATANSSGNTSMIATEVTLSGSRLVPPPYLFEQSVSDLVVFEAARLLKSYPDLNACYLDERTTGYFAEVNFGISFDAGHNLKVLAIRNADLLSLGELQAGFARLLDLYESDAPIAEGLLNCSTVTLSDLSRSGATCMLPLLNANQSLIIGITRRARDQFGLHASFDHRVSEGLAVARFLDELRERLQSHYRPAPPDRVRTLRCSICEQTLEAEIKAGVRGLLRIARPDGSDGYLCRNCFEGW